ncbi:MAG: RdgB/HAM1 family non-canonical purine NTP pyrophosphatase, partial [Bacillota bacterium]
KVREMKKILGDLSAEVLSLADLPGVDSPMETGASFEENAIIKARHAAQASGILSLADDSGLEVDALGGRPGVHSARFAGESEGEGAGDEANNRKLLRLLEGVPENRRTARFKCCIAVCSPDGAVETVTESCEGTICFEPRGSGGFGYDPLFYVKELGMTFAETSVETKNRFSHRGKALRAVRPVIARMLGILSPAGEDNCC